jgi:hypothetical protein
MQEAANICQKEILVHFIVHIIWYHPVIKSKEDTTMKTATAIHIPNYAARRRCRARRAIYPNAASAKYHLGRVLDAALAAASTVGVVVSILFAFSLWG